MRRKTISGDMQCAIAPILPMTIKMKEVKPVDIYPHGVCAELCHAPSVGAHGVEKKKMP